MLPRYALIKRLREFKNRKKVFVPKTREEVLAAVEYVEGVIHCGIQNPWDGDHFIEQLKVLCERTRTLLDQEPPVGFFFKLMKKRCECCEHETVDICDEPCLSCVNGYGEKDNWEEMK